MRTEGELRRVLTELADTAPDPVQAAAQIQLRGAPSVAGATVSTAARRLGQLVLAACVIAVLAVGVAVVMFSRDASAPDPAGPQLEARYQDTVAIEPSAAPPGEWVTLNFLDGIGHGTNFTLETWTGSGWELSYYLVAYSMSGNGWTKSWWAVGDPGGAMPEPFGTPTERVIVPPVAAAGVYRLCQLGDGKPASGYSGPPLRRACGLLTVT